MAPSFEHLDSQMMFVLQANGPERTVVLAGRRGLLALPTVADEPSTYSAIQLVQ
jgi:hypothetical protein